MSDAMMRRLLNRAQLKESCAHQAVVYRPVGGNAIGRTGRWVCYDCGCEFAPKPEANPPTPEESEEKP